MNAQEKKYLIINVMMIVQKIQYIILKKEFANAHINIITIQHIMNIYV